MRKAGLALLLVAGIAVVAEDSPLVALAKRTNRKASKRPVITDAMVKASGGRLATGSADAPLVANPEVAPSEPTPPASATPAAPTTQAAKPTEQPVAPSSAQVNSATTILYPQSSARTIVPESSAVTIIPAGAGAADAQATQSTAQNLPAQVTSVTVAGESTATNVATTAPPH